MSAESIKVAVRVRPLNSREITLHAKPIIRMDGTSTYITNPETGKESQFTFDYSYFSFDPSAPHFANQQTIFKDVGVGVLENAWTGYNCSLFAYGQTGSGKSFSMVGIPTDKGIIPMACEEMFRRIEANSNSDLTFRVEVSMLEIYNEAVRDLFNPKNPANQGGGLKVRENPQFGPYVEGLSSILVKSYADIEKVMEEGTKARTVAATNMNQTSSRAHTIFQIIFTQSLMNTTTGKPAEKVSKVNLIDLAGSERANSTGATGQRLKEGSAINKSLSSLGNCISALADLSSNPKTKVFIPYRDSVLTWLLKESLGGNAKTIMIAALSPADINYEETLSTLKYADRAKRIQNKASINEDPKDKLVRELKDEIERLKTALSASGATFASGSKPAETAGMTDEEKRELLERLEEDQKLISHLEETLGEKEARAAAIQQTRQESLKDAGIDLTELGAMFGLNPAETPHLVNLNEDALMSECLIYFLKEGENRIGRAFPTQSELKTDIRLSGLSIQELHCTITVHGSAITITPGADALTFVDGQELKEPVDLHQGDRVILGNNYIFRVNNPKELRDSSSASGDGPRVIDWAFAQKELAAVQGQLARAELEKKEKEFQEKMRLFYLQAEQDKIQQQQQHQAELEMLKKTIQDQSEAEKAELQAKREELERKSLALANELEAKSKELEETVENETKAVNIDAVVEDKLIRLIPLMNEANLMAKELNRDHYKFDVKIYLDEVSGKMTAGVTVVNTQLNSLVLWDEATIQNRVFIMRDLWEASRSGRITVADLPAEQDPFYDPSEEQIRKEMEDLSHKLSQAKAKNDLEVIKASQKNQELEVMLKLQEEERKRAEASWAGARIEYLKRMRPRRLIVKVLEAKNLPPMDLNGHADPFAVVKFLGIEGKTNKKNKTLNPKWSEQLIFEIDHNFPRSEIGHQHVRIQVIDHDMFTFNDKIGYLSLQFHAVEMYFHNVGFRPIENWYRLEPYNPKHNKDMFIKLAFEIEY